MIIKTIVNCISNTEYRGQFDHVWLMVSYHDRRLAYFLCWHGWMNGFVCICVCRLSHTTTVHCLSQTKAGCISAGLHDEPKTRREDAHNKITAYTLTTHSTTSLNNTSTSRSFVEVSPCGCVSYLHLSDGSHIVFLDLYFFCFCPPVCTVQVSLCLISTQTN